MTRKDGAESVEDGVERGKEGEMRAGDVDGRMVVDQPGEEERCDGADGDDGGDDRGWRAVVRAVVGGGCGHLGRFSVLSCRLSLFRRAGVLWR